MDNGKFRASINKIINSNKLIDVEGSSFDPSIDRLAELMLRAGVIGGSLSEIAADSQNHKRHRLTKFLLCLYATICCRSVLYLVARITKRDSILVLIGDYFSTLNFGGDIVLFWMGSYSFLAFSWALIVCRAELRHRLDIMTDFRNSNGTSLVAKHLSQANLRELKIRTKLCTMFIKSFRYGIFICGYPIHLYGIYVTHKATENYWYTCYTLVWFAVFMVWLRYICDLVSSLIVVLYLSAMYLKTRYEQVNDSISKILMLNHDYDSGYQLQLVWRVIKEHKAISDLVPRHDYVAKWILFGLNYVCSLIVAVSLMAPIYGHFDSVMYKHAINAATVELVCVMVFFAGVAGSVHKQVSDEHETTQMCYMQRVAGATELQRVQLVSSEVRTQLRPRLETSFAISYCAHWMREQANFVLLLQLFRLHQLFVRRGQLQVNY